MGVATAFVIDSWGEYTKREAVTYDCVDLKRTYIRITGDLVSGTMLSQIAYWWLPREDGSCKLWIKKRGFYWLAMKHSDWSEFGIGEWQAANALKHLKKLGLIETQVFRYMGAPTTHIRLLKKSLVVAVEQTLNADEHLRQLWDVEIEPEKPTTPPQPDLPQPPEPTPDEDVNPQVDEEPLTPPETPDVDEPPEQPETPTNPDIEGIRDTPGLDSEVNTDSVIEDSLGDLENNNIQPPNRCEGTDNSAYEDSVVASNTFEETKDKQKIRQLLTRQGIRGASLERITQNHTYEHVQQKVMLYHSRKRAGVAIPNPPGWIVRAIEQDWDVGQPRNYRCDTTVTSPNMAPQKGSAPPAAKPTDIAAQMRQELEQVDTATYSPAEVRKMVSSALGETNEPQPTEPQQMSESQKPDSQSEKSVSASPNTPSPWKAFEPDQPSQSTKRKYSRQQLRQMRDLQVQGVSVEEIREIVGEPELVVDDR